MTSQQVMALDTATGRIRWRRGIRGDQYLRPYLVHPEGLLVTQTEVIERADSDTGSGGGGGVRRNALLLLDPTDGRTRRSWVLQGTPVSLCQTHAGRVYCLARSDGHHPDTLLDLDVPGGKVWQDIPLVFGNWVDTGTPAGGATSGPGGDGSYNLAPRRVGEIAGTGGWLFVQGAVTLATLSPDGRAHGLRYTGSSTYGAVSGPAGSLFVQEGDWVYSLDQVAKQQWVRRYDLGGGVGQNATLGYRNGRVLRAGTLGMEALSASDGKPLWRMGWRNVPYSPGESDSMPETVVLDGQVCSLSERRGGATLHIVDARTGRDRPFPLPPSDSAPRCIVQDAHLIVLQVSNNEEFTLTSYGAGMVAEHRRSRQSSR